MPATNVAWGGATLTVTVSGVDVSCDVRELKVDRSKNRVWDPADAASCRISLDITATGQPANRGPVGAHVKVHIAYGTAARDLFTGKVQSRESTVDPTTGDQLILSCVDEFEQLARVNRRAATGAVAVGAGETVTARIGRWLDESGSSSTRALDASTYTCPAVFIDGNVLRQVQATVLADGGDFFVAGDGALTFKGWAWQVTADAAVAFFSDRRADTWVVYSSAQLVDNLDEVQNKVTGTRRKFDATDPVPQTAVNSSSVTAYGERGDPLDELELDDDTQVINRVAGLVGVAGGANARFDTIVVQPAFDPARSWPRTIPVSFSTLVACNRLWEDGTQTALYGHVIGEVWTFTATDATVEFRCSGTGTWDALRPPRLPLKLEYCPDGSLHVPAGYPCDLTSTVLIKAADGTVLATYPPGSLCSCGTVFVPDGGTELCLDDGTTQVCTDLTDPRIKAVLWFDARDDIPDAMIERVDADVVDPQPGFAGTRLNVIPGSYDAIDASLTGGLVGAQNSTHMHAADFSGGWTVDVWLFIENELDPGVFLDVIDLDSIKVRLHGLILGTDPVTQLELVTISAGEIAHLSGPLFDWPVGAWQHLIIVWSPDTLTVYLNGVVVV